LLKVILAGNKQGVCREKWRERKNGSRKMLRERIKMSGKKRSKGENILILLLQVNPLVILNYLNKISILIC
jgi:hypothetical protein